MDALGINIFNIVIYTILFIVLFFMLKKYLAKPLTEMLEKRAKAVADVQNGKEEIVKERDELNKRSTSLEEKLKREMKDEHDKVILETKQERQKMLADAKAEADAIIAKANARLDQERKVLDEEMTGKIEKAAIKVLKEVYNTEKTSIDPKLIQKALQELS